MANVTSETPLIRLLVLSDLRRIASDDPHADWQRPILDSLVAHVRSLPPALKPQVIAVVGDVTANGEPAQFVAGAAWLDELRHASGLEPDRLLVVAGERDVDRALALKSQAQVREARLVDESAIADLLRDEDRIGFVLKRLGSFLAFADRLRLPRVRGRSWWFRRMQVGEQTIGVGGLCSAWATTGEDGERALIGRPQVDALYAELAGCSLRIALVHHPVDALWDVDRAIDGPLQSRVDLLLTGHTSERRQHQPRLEDRRAAYVEVAPGPLCTAMTGPSHAAMVQVHPDHVRVEPLIYSAQGWSADRVLAPDGAVTLRRRVTATAHTSVSRPTPVPAPPAAAPLPPDPYPVLAPYEHPATFGGRHDDTPRLLDLLQRERLVWALYAASGAGKSSLLRAGLVPALKAKGERVVYWDQPAISALGPHLLRLLDPGTPAVADDDPVAFAAALASLRDQGQRPFLILDQLEEIFASPPALARLGACIAATAMAPAGRACRWVLVYREDFHGRVLDWLADVRRFSLGLDPDLLARLPAKLDGPETLQVWSIPLLGDVPGAPDRLDAAREALQDAIERPLKLLDPDGQPHYPYRIEASHAERLALAFARARMSGPLDPLTPELQVVLDHLIGGRRATRQAPLTLTVPEDPAELDRVVSDAIGAHLRLKLEEVGRRGGSEGVAQRMTSAMLLLMRLADDTGLRQAMPIKDLRLEPSQRAVLEQLKARGVWLVREELRDGEPCLILPHDRIAAEINRIQRDPVELKKYKLDTNLVELWAFVAQRAAAWTAGDEAAVELSWRRHNELERQRTRFPWDEGTRAWWRAAELARERVTRSWVRWGALVAVVLLVFLGGVCVKLDMSALESAVRGQPPASGEPLRALYTLMTRYHYDGAELAGVLGASGEAGSTFNTGTRDEIFGVGPAGLTEAERLAEIPPLVKELAPHVEGATDDESFYGALLAAVEVVRFHDRGVAASARSAVVTAMHAARGTPPAIIPTDDQWTNLITGTFEVGCFTEVEGSACLPREGPEPHVVTLSPYRIKKYEETLGEYLRFDPQHLSGHSSSINDPVYMVTWYESMAYAAWVGATLPTEAQWEVAARGGRNDDYARTAYYNGSDYVALDRVAHTARTQERYGAWSLPAWTPILNTTAHPLELLHILGNVSEWTTDWYAAYPSAPALDPRGPPVPQSLAMAGRIVRGGSWANAAHSVRLAYRIVSLPSNRVFTVGFRLSLPETRATTP